MKPLQNSSCCSDESSDRASSLSLGADNSALTARYLFISIPLFAAWWAIYLNLSTVADLATRQLLSLLKLPMTGHLGSAINFFIYEVPKVLMLLALVVFGVGIVRSFFTPERTRAILAGKRESVGNVLASLLGVVTPFCSCSAVPLFLGFVTTGCPSA